MTGGYSGSALQDTVEVFDLNNMVNCTLPNMPYATDLHAMARLDGSPVTCGGLVGPGW